MRHKILATVRGYICCPFERDCRDSRTFAKVGCKRNYKKASKDWAGSRKNGKSRNSGGEADYCGNGNDQVCIFSALTRAEQLILAAIGTERIKHLTS